LLLLSLLLFFLINNTKISVVCPRLISLMAQFICLYSSVSTHGWAFILFGKSSLDIPFFDVEGQGSWPFGPIFKQSIP